MTQELSNSLNKSFEKIFKCVKTNNIHEAVLEAELLVSWLKVLDNDFEEGDIVDNGKRSEDI